MKIAECSDSFLPIVDGVGTVVTSYAKTLAERNNEVYVITPLDNTGYRGNLPYEIIDFTSINISKKMPWKLGLETTDIHLKEKLKMLDVDIVHVHSPGSSGLVGLNLARKKKVPLIGSFHSKYYDDILKITHNKSLAKLGAKVVADFYNHCDEVWAVSENAGENLKSYGYKGNVIIMPNGTNKRILNVDRISETKKKFKIKDNCPIFLFVGQINWKKNIQRILESCALLKKDGVDFQLVLAGKGPDEKAVKKMATSLGLSDNLIMTGHLADTEVLDCLYSISDLFLFPSIYDNSPMVLREAACMHTPSVVVAGSSASEVVKNGKNSLTCKDDSMDMASTIKKYLALSLEDRTKIRNYAYETIPIPWDGKLMDDILKRYQYTIDNFKGKK